MANKNSLLVVVLGTLVLMATLSVVIPATSSKPYDPFVDLDNNGRIGLSDLVILAQSYGASGTPVNKASIQYDSGWINITDKCGQNIVITHNLNSTDLIVDVQGKTTQDGGPHQQDYGLRGCMQGWDKTYGGTGEDWANALVHTADGGYALAGGGFANLIKTDAHGNAQWNKTYGRTGYDWANALVQTTDGGYALAGYTYSFGAGGYDFWLVKTDAAGNIQWNKTYGGTDDEFAESLVQTADGGYALAGYTGSLGTQGGDADFWLVKTDASGNMQWNKTYGGTYDDAAYALVQTSDGGYALAGSTLSSGAGGNDFWLVKTDASGNKQWNKTYGGPSGDVAYALVQTADVGYALAGITLSYGAGSADSWLVKTDASGNKQWDKTYGGTDWDEAYALVQTTDGGYALAGSTGYIAGSADSWLVKTDASGNKQWDKTYGGTSYDQAYALVQTTDGGYALAGSTESFGAGNRDFWLVKTDAAGNIGGVESGLAWGDSSANTITLYRGATDIYWNYVRVRLWMPEQTP
jgi:hypothetical protein